MEVEKQQLVMRCVSIAAALQEYWMGFVASTDFAVFAMTNNKEPLAVNFLEVEYAELPEAAQVLSDLKAAMHARCAEARSLDAMNMWVDLHPSLKVCEEGRISLILNIGFSRGKLEMLC